MLAIGYAHSRRVKIELLLSNTLVLNALLTILLLELHVSVFVLLASLCMRHRMTHTLSVPILGVIGVAHAAALSTWCHRKHQSLIICIRSLRIVLSIVVHPINEETSLSWLSCALINLNLLFVLVDYSKLRLIHIWTLIYLLDPHVRR